MLLDHLLTSSASAPTLRVALLVENGALSRPLALAVEHLQRSAFARVELVIDERPPAPAAAGVLGRLASATERTRLLFDLYARWDAARVKDAARLLAPVPFEEVVPGAPVVRVEPIDDRGLRRYPAEAVARLRAHAVDVALRCGSGRLAGDALDFARHGVWSLAPGHVVGDRATPLHFWELAEEDPLSAVTVEVMRPGSAEPLVLCVGRASTLLEDAELSMLRNRVKPALLGAALLVRELKTLHEDGPGALEQRAQVEPARRSALRRHVPSNVEMARFIAPRIAHKAWNRLARRPTVVHWRIAVRVNGAPRYDAGRSFDLSGFRWIEAPRGRLYADPCLLERGGQVHCLFEDLDHATGIGRISCAVVDDAGRFRDVRPALERPYHLSYPFVFEDGGDVFMIPESRKNGTVDLFRAVEFPSRWEKVRTLLDVPGLDTTVVRHGGRYWFFVTVRDPPGAGEQLYLLAADSLSGELRFHRRNPVSADVRYCRSAGALFVDSGRLIRPSQDCSVTYGRQLHFHEVTRLDEGGFAERLLTTASPPPGLQGVHTYSRFANVEVIDGKRMEPVGRHLAD